MDIIISDSTSLSTYTKKCLKEVQTNLTTYSSIMEGLFYSYISNWLISIPYWNNGIIYLTEKKNLPCPNSSFFHFKFLIMIIRSNCSTIVFSFIKTMNDYNWLFKNPWETTVLLRCHRFQNKIYTTIFNFKEGTQVNA